MNIVNDPSQDIEPARPSPEALDPSLLRVAGVVVLGALMSILDTTVINVAIRGLTTAFDSPLETVQWYRRATCWL